MIKKILGSMFPGKVRVAYGNRIRELYGKSEQLAEADGTAARSGPTITDDYTYQTSDPESPRPIRKHKFTPPERVSLVGNKRVSFAD